MTRKTQQTRLDKGVWIMVGIYQGVCMVVYGCPYDLYLFNTISK